MSDTPAQSPTNLASSLRSNKSSAVGSLLRRGLTGSGSKAAPVSGVVSTSSSVPAPIPTPDEVDILEKIITEVGAQKVVEPEQPAEQSENQSVAQPLQPQASIPAVLPQVLPQVLQHQIDQQPGALNPPQAVGSSASKEAIDTATPDQTVVDAARGAQQVEQEPNPEISPEVESYIKRVEDHQETAPQEIVIADGSGVAPTQAQLPAQPVVVVPITPEVEKEGEKKSPQFSVRWLVEWSKKIMKTFTGKVIYRQKEAGND